ncbi:DUF1326 domain-containing protein [Streptomyces glomeratus]|uniref:DUF1326 domain-containing protein n=1 Tax=Streptomyces glomeratus TaxID=284452 RepID=A0ABP6LKM5_9ACTN|nr:DUF1326 domain-containing protein [Streptomyces glomeratus]MCF1511258.1 DUF1326 domain-containing protein [Streptomyces glomeratus]
MAWNLSGTYLESCNCDVVCPCTTSGLTAPADRERCQVTFAFHIERGEVDGVDVSDRNVVVFADTPRLMADGGWQVALYVDGSADDRQADALGKVFSGQAGGPMAALAPLVAEVLGVERVPIGYHDDGRRHSVRVSDVIDIEIEDQVAPQFGEGGPVMRLTGMFHPASSTLTIARSTRAIGRGVHGRSWDFTGGNGHAAPFSWAA